MTVWSAIRFVFWSRPLLSSAWKHGTRTRRPETGNPLVLVASRRVLLRCAVLCRQRVLLLLLYLYLASSICLLAFWFLLPSCTEYPLLLLLTLWWWWWWLMMYTIPDQTRPDQTRTIRLILLETIPSQRPSHDFHLSLCFPPSLPCSPIIHHPSSSSSIYHSIQVPGQYRYSVPLPSLHSSLSLSPHLGLLSAYPTALRKRRRRSEGVEGLGGDDDEDDPWRMKGEKKERQGAARWVGGWMGG